MSKTQKNSLIPHQVSNFHPHRVLYAEVDKMNIVYYANYFAWFEEGRGELLRKFNFTYQRMEDEMQLFLPVTQCSATYNKPARYDDLLIIESKLKHLTQIKLFFEYNVYLAENLREPDFSDISILTSSKKPGPIVTGTTEHIFLNKEGRITRAGKQLAEILTGLK